MKQYILIIALFILSLFLGYKWYDNYNKSKTIQESLEVINNGWKFQVNQKDSTIVSQQQVILDKNSDLAKQADTIQGLKNQTQRVKVITRTIIKHDTIQILSSQTITIDSADFLRLPYSFSKTSKWYGYSFTLEKSKVSLDSLYFSSETEIIWGKEDHGTIKNIFKENKPIVSVIQKNPYTTTTELQNYTFKDFNPQRLSLGTQIGYGITPKGFQPYLGVGLSLKIL